MQTGTGHLGRKSTGKNRSKGDKRQSEDEELDVGEDDRQTQPHRNEDQVNTSDGEVPPPVRLCSWPHFHFVRWDESMCPLQRKARRITKHISPSDNEGSDSHEHPRSPPLLTTGQKQKQREVQDQLPTPSGSTQAQQTPSQYRERPGASARAHRTQHQPRTIPSSMDRRRAAEHRRGQSSTTHPERTAVNSRWTHIAKVFAMERSPWLSEPVLDRVLHSTGGEDLSETDVAYDLACILDQFEVGDDVRKDKRFRANVTSPLSGS